MFGSRQSATEWTQEQFDATTARANELQVEFVWNLVRVLYDRRPASSLYRDLFEEVVLSPASPITDFKRGVVEPCVYHSPSTRCVLTHHIDDGRIVGPGHVMAEILRFLRRA